jgi:hypothetical protein
LSSSFACESFRYKISSAGTTAPTKHPNIASPNRSKQFACRWNITLSGGPMTAIRLTAVRRSLFECEPEVTLELVQLLTTHEACSKETLRRLVGTPALQKHLTDVSQKLLRIGFDGRTVEQNAEEQRQKSSTADGLFSLCPPVTTVKRFMRKSGPKQSSGLLRDTTYLMSGSQRFAEN